MGAIGQSVYVLRVGQGEPGRFEASEALGATVDALGSWWAFESHAQARAHAARIFDAEPGARVVVDRGVGVRGARWLGPVCARMTDAALWVEEGACAVSASCHEEMRILGLGSELERPLGLRGAPSRWYGARFEESDQEPGKVTWRPRTNLTWSHEVLVAREREVAALDEAARAGARVYVSGVAGVGKTSVVEAWARARLRGDGAARIWRVECAGVSGVEALAERIAQACGVGLRGRDRGRWMASVAAGMCPEGEQVCWVVEDVEGLDEEASAWLEGLMRACHEGAWVLSGAPTTSWPGAARVEVGPLELDAGVALLAERARLTRMDGPTLERLSGWVEVCEGLPASLVLLDEATLREEADASRAPTAAGVAAAWARLDADARDALTCWWAFEGGFGAGLAARVAGLEGEGEAVERARGLVRAGWLVGEGEVWSMPRYVRAAVGRLGEAPRRERARARLDEAVCAEVVERARGDEVARGVWMERHEADVLGALGRLLEAGERGVFAPLWAARAHFNEHRFASRGYRRALERALELAARRGWGELEAPTMVCLFQAMDVFHGEVEEVRAYLAQVRARADELGAPERALVELLGGRFMQDNLERQEDVDEARRALEEAWGHAERAGDDALMARAAALRVECARGPEDARAWVRRAREAAARSGAPSARFAAAFAAHRGAMEAGDLEAAAAAARDALREERALRRPERVVMLLASQGYVETLRGEGMEARRHLFEALSLAREVGFWFGEVNCQSLLGVAHMLDLEWDMARALLERAREMNLTEDTTWNVRQIELHLACCLAALGALDEAEEVLERARGYFEGLGDDHHVEVARCVGAGLEVARASRRERDPERLDALRAELEGFEGAGAAAIVVGRWLEAEARSMRGGARAPLVVEGDGERIKAPGEDEWVSLARKKSKRRIVEALVGLRLDAPGETLTAHELFEVGWPGERPDVRTGLMRVYVAINALRKLGLAEVLETFEEGYRISPTVPVERVAA
jgi:tetratricopeptide (TPR) repeat protein